MQIVGNPDTYLAAMEVYESISCDANFEGSPWQSKRFTVELR